MVKLKDLKYLIAIDDHKHFGRAAEACFVSQPTLSGQVMKLEAQLELQLIERHNRKIMLTPAGEILIREARKVLQAVDVFESKAKSLLDPLSGDLHAGFIPTLGPYLFPHIMPRLNTQLSNINFFLHEDKTHELLSKLNDGRLDFLILPYLDEMKMFKCFDLFEEELFLATSRHHPLANKKTVCLEDINREHVLTLEDGHCLRNQSLGYCFSAGAHEDHRYQAASLETLRHMVAAELGVTLFPRFAALNRDHETNIKYIPFSSPQPKRQISLLVRPHYYRMSVIEDIARVVRESIVALNLLEAH